VEEGELASGGGKKRRHLIPIRRLGTRERNVDRPAVGATPHHTYPCRRAVASFVRCQSGHAERVQIRVRAATYRAVAWRGGWSGPTRSQQGLQNQQNRSIFIKNHSV
jgi:hypothetical protein